MQVIIIIHHHLLVPLHLFVDVDGFECRMLRYKLETQKTTLYPDRITRRANEKRAKEAERLAKAAQGKRSDAGPRAAPQTFVALEELVGALVQRGERDGWLKLRPEGDLYYCVGTTAAHVKAFDESAPIFERAWFIATDAARVIGQTQSGFNVVLDGVEQAATFSQMLEQGLAPITLEEAWRRFLGQQLYLLAELILLAMPNWFVDNPHIFDPASHRKKMGTTRSDLSLHSEHFVTSKSAVNTASVRQATVAFARGAQVRDVMYASDDARPCTGACGLQLPAEHDEATFFLLR